MSRVDLAAAINGARREVFRLEVQQSYAGVPDPDWDAWQAHGRLNPPTAEEQERYARLAARVAAGVLQHRACVVDEPLDPYLGYELTAFRHHNVPAGEHILVARRAEHPDLATLTEDFWMVDEEFVAVMNYDTEHRPLGPSAPTRPVSEYVSQRDLALSYASPLDRWMTEHPELLTG